MHICISNLEKFYVVAAKRCRIFVSQAMLRLILYARVKDIVMYYVLTKNNKIRQ